MLNVLWFLPPAIALLSPNQTLISASRTRGSDQQFSELVSGRCDLAVTAMDNVMGWNARPGGGDFRIIAQMEKTTTLVVMSRPEIKSIGELKGRRVLVDAAENGFVIALLVLLRDGGVGRDEVTLIEAGGVTERSEALTSGAGDVTLLGPPFDAAAAQRGMVRLANVNALYPDFPGQGIVARQSRLQEVGAEVRLWLEALEEGRRIASSTPERARRLIEANGISAPLAQAMVGAVPNSLLPSRSGVEMLIAHRRLLNLPGAQVDYAGLVDVGWIDL